MHIRPASLIDARALAELLNAIIKAGGTTAMTEPLMRSEMEGWIDSNKAQNAFLVAENGLGDLLGFQTIGPCAGLPEAACDIATFAKKGREQLGIGSALFAHTAPAARALGYGWINAAVRRENSGGIAYYQSRGFEPYVQESERVLMRYSLR